MLTDNQIDHFVDVDFPPTLASIADPDESFPFEQEIIWKRAKDFLLPTNSRRPEVISDDTHPSSIIASQILGSQWLTGALACLAEHSHQHLLQKLLITKDYQVEGTYKV